MIRHLISILLLGLSLVACTAKQWDHPDVTADTKKSKPVVGGFEVASENFEAAYVVMIYGEKASGESYVCTGTFISDSAVLTAAHCLSEDFHVMSMFFGVKPFEVDAVSLPILDVKTYGSDEAVKLDNLNRHDLALIYFSGGLPEGAKIAQLPTIKDDIENAHNILALGYGRTNGTDELGTSSQDVGTLREVLLDRKNISLDQNSFTLNQKNGRGVCYGDSGGPALMLGEGADSVYVVGVASGVYGNSSGTIADDCRNGSLYMKTSSYLVWLKEFAVAHPLQ